MLGISALCAEFCVYKFGGYLSKIIPILSLIVFILTFLITRIRISGLYLPEWSNALCKDRSHLDMLGIGAYDNGRLFYESKAKVFVKNIELKEIVLKKKM